MLFKLLKLAKTSLYGQRQDINEFNQQVQELLYHCRLHQLIRI